MKIFKSVIALLALSLSLNATAATRYVSDDIFIYLHSGPSLDYRITGAVKVGTQVTTLQHDDSTNFVEIKTATGKTGWAQDKQLQDTLPANVLLPKAQAKLKETQAKLATIVQENEQKLQEKVQLIAEKESIIANLQSEMESQQEKIDTLQANNLELDLLQDTKEERVKMEWMMYGGSVLFFGLLLGLVIPFLPRRKKRRDGW